MKQTKTPPPTKIAFDLHYGQAQTWRARSTHRIVSMFAGSGGGKTYLGPRWFYPRMREHLDATYLFLEPTYKMLTRVMLPIVLPFFESLRLGTFHKAEMLYELVGGGGRVLFGSIDNPNSIQGVHVDGGIWADEIGLYSEEAWDVILQRTALYKAPILNTSTPYTLPWVERRLAQPARDPRTRDEYWIIQYPSWWNPAYPIDQYWALKRMWPADKFARLMEGLFTRVTGLMFDSYEEDRHLAFIEPCGERQIRFTHPIEGTRIIEVVRAWMGQDWGWSPDPGCQLLFVADGMGRAYCIGEEYDCFVPVQTPDPEADTWVKRAWKAHTRWGLDVIWCDPSMPAYIDAMCKARLPAKGANNTIAFGTMEVNQAFHERGDGTYGLYIAQNACPNLTRTIGTYVHQRAPTGEAFLPSPAPYQEDHPVDCLRYGITGDHDDDDHAHDIPALILGAKRKGR